MIPSVMSHFIVCLVQLLLLYIAKLPLAFIFTQILRKSLIFLKIAITSNQCDIFLCLFRYQSNKITLQLVLMGCSQLNPIGIPRRETETQNEVFQPLIAESGQETYQAPPKSRNKPIESKAGAPISVHYEYSLRNPSSKDIGTLQKLDQGNRQKLEHGQEQMKNKDYYAALEWFMNIHPRDEYILNLIGQAHYQNYSYAEALEWYDKSLEKNRKYPPTYFKKSMVYYYKRQYDQAIKQLELCLQITGQNAEVLSQIGENYYWKQDYKNAESYQLKALKLEPKNVEIIERLALIYYYQQIYLKCIYNYKKIVAIEPNNHRIINDIGYTYYMMEDYTQAEKWYLKALKISPYNSKYCYRLGMNSYYAEDYQKSREWHLKAIERNEYNDEYYSEIGRTYYEESNYSKAIEWYQKALDRKRQNYLTHYRLGLVYYYLEDYSKSITCQKASLCYKQNYWGAFNAIGNCYFYQQNYEQAIKYYKLSIQQEPKKHTSQIMCGKSLYYAEKIEQSVTYFQQASKINPSDVFCQVYLGKALFEIENFRQSYQVFKIAKETFDKLSEVKQVSGSTFLKEEIENFIRNSAEWEEKKKFGYISSKDKEEIKKMKEVFQKKFRSIFGLNSDEEERTKKPLNPAIVSIAKLIYDDQFELDITKGDAAPIFIIAEHVRQIYNYDRDVFQIFAYIFQQYAWNQEYNNNSTYSQIEEKLLAIVKALSAKFPPTKDHGSSQKKIELPRIPEKQVNLFTETHYFSSYQQLIKEIERVNQSAKNDLAPFRTLVFSIEKAYKGSHALVGMKLPDKEGLSTQEYQQKMFKVLIRIFQKMFKELSYLKDQIFKTIQARLQKEKVPIYSILNIIMNIWITQINTILLERQNKLIVTECYISDLVRGKCMFDNVQDLKRAVLGAISHCKEKGFEVTQLDNRLLKKTQDVVLKIRIKEAICQLQLALEFDTVAFEFQHSFYEISRCPLGCIFGSCLFLTKKVDLSFLLQIKDTVELMEYNNSDDQQGISALRYVIQTFQNSSDSQ